VSRVPRLDDLMPIVKIHGRPIQVARIRDRFLDSAAQPVEFRLLDSDVGAGIAVSVDRFTYMLRFSIAWATGQSVAHDCNGRVPNSLFFADSIHKRNAAGGQVADRRRDARLLIVPLPQAMTIGQRRKRLPRRR
jgi:hypothetical protein